MSKKFQVFISSTYLDMKEERQNAVQAVLDAGHIPAGMELFAASDQQQLQVIKSWIDDSDIFMLLLGGRYGSIDPHSKKSYIQLEYEYAVQKHKPFFALYLTDMAIDEKVKSFGRSVIEQNDTKAYNDFRAAVRSRLCSEIDEPKDIFRHVQKSIASLAQRRDLVGWVRANRNEVPTHGNSAIKIVEREKLHDSLEVNELPERINVSMPSSVLKRIDEYAYKHRTTRSSLLVKAALKIINSDSE